MHTEYGRKGERKTEEGREFGETGWSELQTTRGEAMSTAIEEGKKEFPG